MVGKNIEIVRGIYTHNSIFCLLFRIHMRGYPFVFGEAAKELGMLWSKVSLKPNGNYMSHIL
jgi:hypothetical protein